MEVLDSVIYSGSGSDLGRLTSVIVFAVVCMSASASLFCGVCVCVCVCVCVS